MKKNKLGLFLHHLTDDQIKLVFAGIFGWNVHPDRNLEGFLRIINLDTNEVAAYPTNLQTWKETKL